MYYCYTKSFFGDAPNVTNGREFLRHVGIAPCAENFFRLVAAKFGRDNVFAITHVAEGGRCRRVIREAVYHGLLTPNQVPLKNLIMLQEGEELECKSQCVVQLQLTHFIDDNLMELHAAVTAQAQAASRGRRRCDPARLFLLPTTTPAQGDPA